jgi:hypothetical protein
MPLSSHDCIDLWLRELITSNNKYIIEHHSTEHVVVVASDFSWGRHNLDQNKQAIRQLSCIAMDLLHELLPVLVQWTPTVQPPSKNSPPTLQDKAITTLIILILYMSCSQVYCRRFAPDFLPPAKWEGSCAPLGCLHSLLAV